MKIAMSCKTPKVCAKCKKDIYTFEKRHVRNNGEHQHLIEVKK